MKFIIKMCLHWIGKILLPEQEYTFFQQTAFIHNLTTIPISEKNKYMYLFADKWYHSITNDLMKTIHQKYCIYTKVYGKLRVVQHIFKKECKMTSKNLK